MIILGVVTVRALVRVRRIHPTPEWNLALLILAIALILFWTVPRSIDLAANHAGADQMMHLSWFLAGALLAHTLPQFHLIVAMALGTHAVAMLIAIGLVYTRYPGLICSAYNLQQQHATGRVMLWIAPALALCLWGWGLKVAQRESSGKAPIQSSS